MEIDFQLLCLAVEGQFRAIFFPSSFLLRTRSEQETHGLGEETQSGKYKVA